MKVAEAVASLRELADYLELHAEAIGDDSIHGTVTIFPERIAPLIVQLEGRWAKDGDGPAMTFTRRFGGLALQVWGLRSEVCTAKPTGRKITKTVPTGYTTIEVDEVEWDCSPVLKVAAESAA